MSIKKYEKITAIKDLFIILSKFSITSLKSKIDIPTTKEIISESYDKIKKDNPNMLKSDFITKNFSQIVELFFDEAYKIYLKYENRIIEKLTQNTLDKIEKDTLTKDEVKIILGKIVKESITLEKA